MLGPLGVRGCQGNGRRLPLTGHLLCARLAGHLLCARPYHIWYFIFPEAFTKEEGKSSEGDTMSPGDPPDTGRVGVWA